jgi:hypothetical protein
MMIMRVKWRDDAGEHETEVRWPQRLYPADGRVIACELAEKAHHDSGSEAYRDVGELEILSPPEIAGKYRIMTDYEPTFTAFTIEKG